MVLEHRAEIVGEEHKHSRKSSYVVGQLFLAGVFFDPGADREHANGITLAKRQHDVVVALLAAFTANRVPRDLQLSRGFFLSVR